MRFYLIVCIFFPFFAFGDPYPIQFSIPESKIVQDIPEKDKDFASLIPGKIDTYIYHQEKNYYKDYQRSYYALTWKKAGADCMRHYEILACGCIPYFTDLDSCHPKSMAFLPKELIKEAMNLEGVSYMKIDHSKFDKKRYFEILEKLLNYTRNYLTTKSLANYLLKTVNYSGVGKILYLSHDVYPDYLRCLTLIGLKQSLGNAVIDYPKIPHIYTNYRGKVSALYGKGFSYSKIIEDEPVNRSNLEERIKNQEFELIIYGSVHRGMPFYDLVLNTYSEDRIIYMCGEDAHECGFTHLPNFFLREYDCIPKKM